MWSPKTALLVYADAMDHLDWAYYRGLTSSLDLQLVGCVEDEPDILLLVDGPPVHPQMYGHSPNLDLSYDEARDGLEIYTMNKTKSFSKPCLVLGIGARGASVVNVWNGGKLTVNPISFSHNWVHAEGTFARAEMAQLILCPTNGKEKLIKYEVWTEEVFKHPTAPRIVWYPETHSLCFQLSTDGQLLRRILERARLRISL